MKAHSVDLQTTSMHVATRSSASRSVAVSRIARQMLQQTMINAKNHSRSLLNPLQTSQVIVLFSLFSCCGVPSAAAGVLAMTTVFNTCPQVQAPIFFTDAARKNSSLPKVPLGLRYEATTQNLQQCFFITEHPDNQSMTSVPCAVVNLESNSSCPLLVRNDRNAEIIRLFLGTGCELKPDLGCNYSVARGWSGSCQISSEPNNIFNFCDPTKPWPLVSSESNTTVSSESNTTHILMIVGITMGGLILLLGICLFSNYQKKRTRGTTMRIGFQSLVNENNDG